jgi:uncharacterized integral membrane protein
MIVLGLIFLAAAVVAAIELVVANDSAQVTVHMWRWSWTVDPFWLAVAGAVILAVGVLGVLMLRAGGKRGRRLRRERRELRAENRRLAKRAEQVQPAQAPLVGGKSRDDQTSAGTPTGAPTAKPSPAGAPTATAVPPGAPTATPTRPAAYPPPDAPRAEAPADGRHQER